MKAKHIAFDINGKGDKTVFADGHLLTLNASARRDDAFGLDNAVFAPEVQQHTVSPEGTPSILIRAAQVQIYGL